VVLFFYTYSRLSTIVWSNLGERLTAQLAKKKRRATNGSRKVGLTKMVTLLEIQFDNFIAVYFFAYSTNPFSATRLIWVKSPALFLIR
jgi:hypothetical protein